LVPQILSCALTIQLETCFAGSSKKKVLCFYGQKYHRLAREVAVARENGSLGARRRATATARRPEYVPAASPAVAAVYSIGIRTDRCATDRSLCEFGSGDSVPSAPATALVDSAVRDPRRPLVSYPERGRGISHEGKYTSGHGNP
jgi:hypothetical protein